MNMTYLKIGGERHCFCGRAEASVKLAAQALKIKNIFIFIMLMHAFTTRNVLKIILSLKTPLIAAKFILNDRNYLSCSLRRLLGILLHNLKTNQKLVLQFTRRGERQMKNVKSILKSKVLRIRWAALCALSDIKSCKLNFIPLMKFLPLCCANCGE